MNVTLITGQDTATDQTMAVTTFYQTTTRGLSKSCNHL